MTREGLLNEQKKIFCIATDSYCACDVSLFCAECISINENCEKCVDFFSYDDMENLSSNGGGLLSE